ncbi:MAG: hypothetical protein E5X72_01730 [Mesorhizobium sp.]|uniref:hypothetical protein n=1 Tax=Mesorhizobium sp. TaxID=1871066 RepID=UPI0012036494|nr:hypothetical protein [Mesorhizobium sp.]TIP06463.1 MAG: hypothetical protein E5X72_01730 [Mesorhizobium sp.]
MTDRRFNSFKDVAIWDGADAEAVAEKATELYGSYAVTAAAHCALAAHFDGRKSDYRFWFNVFSLLGGAGAMRN